MDIIEEINDSDGGETIKDEFVLITDADSDEETFYTYATFATCEEAEEVVASMRYLSPGQEEVFDNKEVIVDEYGNPITIPKIDTEDMGYAENIEEISAEDAPGDNLNIWHIQKVDENPTGVEEYEINVMVNEPNETHQTTWQEFPSTETNHNDVITLAAGNSYEINDDSSGEYENMLMNVGNINKSHTCPYCGNNHRSAGPLKLHMRACRRKKYPEEDTKKCTICEKTFQGERFLKQHLLLHHYGAYCTRCFRSFRNNKKLKEHIEEHKLLDEQSPHFDGSNLRVKAFTCCNCSKQFSVVFANGGIKRRYVCDPCREMFANAENSKQPKEVKRRGKRVSEYSCNSCERKFVFIGSLQRHMDECNGRTAHSSRKVVVK